MTIKWSFSYITPLLNFPFITQFTYNTVHIYGPQTKHFKGTALHLFLLNHLKHGPFL